MLGRRVADIQFGETVAKTEPDHLELPSTPSSAPMRSAALSPEPVTTAIVVSSGRIEPSPKSRDSAAPAVAAVGSTKTPTRPRSASAGAISFSATATTLPFERRTARSTSAIRTGLGAAIPSAIVGSATNFTKRSSPVCQAAAKAAQFAAWTAKRRGRAVISPLRSSSSKPRSSPRMLLP